MRRPDRNDRKDRNSKGEKTEQEYSRNKKLSVILIDHSRKKVLPTLDRKQMKLVLTLSLGAIITHHWIEFTDENPSIDFILYIECGLDHIWSHCKQAKTILWHNQTTHIQTKKKTMAQHLFWRNFNFLSIKTNTA